MTSHISDLPFLMPNNGGVNSYLKLHKHLESIFKESVCVYKASQRV